MRGQLPSPCEALERRRLLSAEVDEAFGFHGFAFLNNVGIHEAALTADGKIVATDNGVARYLANGTLDPTFGATGRVAMSTTGQRNLHLDSVGRIILSGFRPISVL